jgi:flagellar basal-body rod protein FlgB
MKEACFWRMHMGISFDKALGVYENALNVRVKRAEVIANNLANADTPGFKARDIDFRAILKGATNNDLAMTETSPEHMGGAQAQAEQLLYRNPTQPSIDGNTVDTQREISEYTKNMMDFQANFRFLNSKFKGLVSAIKGD